MRDTKLDELQRSQPGETPFHSTTTDPQLLSIDANAPIADSEQKTIVQEQDAQHALMIDEPDEETLSQEEKIPIHTPLPYRRYTGLPLPVKIIAVILAALLFISGMAFIVYGEITQYRVSLKHGATVLARNTRDAYSTVQAQIQQTAAVLNTAQSHIDATATAQANAAANATAAVDNATATASALSNLYTQYTSGDPVFNDSLTDNTGPGQWDEGTPSTNTGCAFVNGYYDVSEATQGNLQPCIAQATSFDSFAYQVNLTINKGNLGQAGLIFRADSSNTSYYFFHIDTTGSFGLDLYDQSGQISNLTQGVNSAITIGLGQSNQLAVVADSDNIYLYANGQYLASVVDSTLSAGKVGLGVVDKSTPVDVQFDTAQVWSPLSTSPSSDTPTPTSTTSP